MRTSESKTHSHSELGCDPEPAVAMTTAELTIQLKAEALRLGFDGVGVAPAVAPPGHGHLVNWLGAGHSAGMTYMQRGVETRRRPDALLQGVRSVVMVSLVYGEPIAEPSSPDRGKVARYARGLDYHRILWDKLEELLDWLRRQRPETQGRALADTAPLMERDFARLAGLGWIGKNTMLINRRWEASRYWARSWSIVTSLSTNRMWRITAAPAPAVWTRAPPAPSSRRTSSTLGGASVTGLSSTKERSPPEFAGELHGWVFGCDVCQDVCPWNRKSPKGRLVELQGRQEWSNPDLIEWLDRDESAWRTALRGTALSRTKRVGLVRNAALVLGERQVTSAVPALARRLADDGEHPVVRGAAAWALGRIGTEAALEALRETGVSTDSTVRDANSAALAAVRHESKNRPPG